MSNKMKWMMLALLGFTTACSTVKHNAKSKNKDKGESAVPQEAVEGSDNPQIRVLYGVRPPVPVEADEASRQEDSLRVTLLYGVRNPETDSLRRAAIEERERQLNTPSDQE